ncbi:MAG: alpha/beta fold hydrolase, partial [Planctomycetes bacterium]|nr:alpha/beta fold hydrolase [Planctomycetota bacterium]
MRSSVASVPSADGVSISHYIYGSGTPALVFVHGGMCDHSYWDEQVAHFASQYAVVTLDLAAHGDSGIGRKNWTMEAFGGDVAAVVNHLDLKRIILIGHGMGGPVMVEAASLIPERIMGLVGVDVSDLEQKQMTPDQLEVFMTPMRTNFVKTIRDAAEKMFVITSDPTLKRRIIKDMSSAPPQVSTQAMEELFKYSLPSKIEDLSSPLMLINSCEYTPTNLEVAQRYGVEVMMMSGVGHFGMLEDPATFNRLLREAISKFVDENTPSSIPQVKTPLLPAHKHNIEDSKMHEPSEDIRKIVKKLLAEELHMEIEAIDDKVPFTEIGLDSISGVTWVREINTQYGLSITAHKVYDYPTIDEFVNYITKEAQLQGVVIHNRQELSPPVSTQEEASQSNDFSKSLIKVRSSNFALRSLRRGRHRFVSYQDRPNVSETGGRVEVLEKKPEEGAQGIAVIGISGQFPKAKDLKEYWENIAQGRSCISEVPETRWSINQYYDSNPGILGKTYCKWMGVLEDADQFDPLFFNISPKQAEAMDPQQRLLLQSSWRCIEDAGYDPTSLSESKCGVFVGCSPNDYMQGINGKEVDAQSVLGGDNSILAGQISYILNLKGPCLSIDTACSSSLVGMANACDSLNLGNCNLALAGGVWIMPGPSVHIGMSQIRALSPDGRCFTFDQRANGFVPGEGVGVVLLKRLEDAKRDGDHIYGVIKGWGVNQDGKTNGITAPNSKSQNQLEKGIYEKFSINPGGIQLVETHGTGTKLGDPIEVEALCASFKSFTQKENYCALGSVKSNIGHLAPAAGIAGVLKVLLSLQYRKLPPTIHFQTLNEHITLEGSPFYVNTECQNWSVPEGEKRRAAVNSFGYSGTNAHMVIEEYCAKRSKAHSIIEIQTKDPFIIPLSARTKEQLEQQVRDLFELLHMSLLVDLQSLAYTLQVGREAMEERLGFIVTSVHKKREKLEAYLLGNQEIEECYQGQVKRNKDTLAIFTADEDMSKIINIWLSKKKYNKFLDLWVKGLTFDWNKLYGDNKPKRISLPTYPFARERYWLSETQGKANVAALDGSVSVIHPLLHENTSDLSEQRFTSTFTGKEFFLNDHQVKGEKVFPGVGNLEMARAAVEKASGEREAVTVVHLKNVVWSQPIVVDGSDQKVHIGLFEEDDGQIQYEVYTESENEEDAIVHSQGIAEFRVKEETHPLNIQDLLSQMNQGTMNAESCYKAFKEMGIEYGEGYRGVREIYQGEGQLLARLSLPSPLKDTQSEYVLHPCLMDSALQSSIGLMINNGALTDGSEVHHKASLPFALISLEILSPCTSEMYAWVRYSDGSAPSDKVQKFDIDLCDEPGNVCIELRGVSYVIGKITFEKKAATRWEFLKSEEPAQNSHSSSLSSEEKIQKFLQQAVAEQLQKSAHQIQVNQSFFEIGIGSLGIVQVVKQLEALLDVVLSPTLLFEYVNIKQLSAYVSQQFTDRVNSLIMVPQKVEIQQIKDSSTKDSSRGQNYKLLIPYQRKKRWVDPVNTHEIQQEESVNIKKRHSLNFPLSEGEKGLWMLQTANKSMSAYNVPICYQISGNTNLEYLEKAWDFVLEQYPILKARILEKEGIPYHCITEECKTTIQKEHITIKVNKELLYFLQDQVKQPFNLGQGPLTRIQVFTRKNKDPILLITIHPIVIDGTSELLLMESLLKTYRQIAAGTAPSHNRDISSYEEFVLWEQTMLESPEGKR